MRVNRYFVPVIVIVALLGTVFVAQAFGWWSTSGRTTTDLEALTAADIKGWMTLQQVADGMNLSLTELYRLGGIPAEITPETALKDLEGLVEGFETSTLREALTANLTDAATVEVTAEPIPAIVTPLAATLVPTTEPEFTPETTLTAEHNGTGTGPTPLPPGQLLPADQIKGRLTLREVSEQCGVDLAALLAGLMLPADTNVNTQLKTLVETGVIDEVSQVQAVVGALQANS
jgi:hypothetical protein